MVVIGGIFSLNNERVNYMDGVCVFVIIILFWPIPRPYLDQLNTNH